jgi:2-(1,2-epoxy-1,2-dihydrophenyl)acetyl-CoA isomerase
MRPDAANALNGEAFREIWEASLRCDDEPEIRAVIITATGRMFCSGGDLKDFASKGDGLPKYLTESATLFHAAITRFQRMDAPVVMAVNGVAAGAGISLAASGDVVIASEEALFVSAYTASGLTPDGSATYFLAKHVGLMRAKEMVLLNRRLTAAEALDWGLVTRVVPPEKLMDEAREIAAGFASGPTRAFGGSKRLLLDAYSAALEAQLERESVSIADMARTRDGRHGIETFAARGKPTFEGR